jgi:hypothetical protein
MCGVTALLDTRYARAVYRAEFAVMNEPFDSYGCKVFAIDAQTDPEEPTRECGVRITPSDSPTSADAILAGRG